MTNIISETKIQNHINSKFVEREREREREKSRITSLDSLKGLLIILVIVGHYTTNNSIVGSFIYIFHMPAFFILSGMFVKPLADGQTKSMIIKYVKAYLIPIFLTGIILIMIYFILYFCLSNPNYKIDSIPFIARLLIGSYDPRWFLFALFWGLVIFRILLKYLDNIMLPIVILFIFCFAYLIFNTLRSQYNITVASNFGQGLTSVLFLYIGYSIKRHRDNINDILNTKIAYIIITFIIGYVLFTNAKIDVAGFIYPLGLTSVVFSTFTSVFIIFKSKYIDCRFLNYIGQHTLLIFCIHSIFFMVYSSGNGKPISILYYGV